ncbi:type-1 angiotensin II receptor A [Pimephales promelas]|uniref:type-1 angiotensin II receptor A n=1 Tax=Pimephales promelas TaxID=90988 RepID=UPI00195560CF|nr:type-1 angiotensin II receptor A [Pimephales promelas]KAG1956444.1 visual pigment-like receptor peropsin [Pimephales promelas]
MNTSNNITESEENYWSRIEKSVLAPILTTEMVLGVLGNGLVLIVKIVCKDHYQSLYWLPLLSLTLSDFFCSILVICGSLLAVLSDGQISPWCEVVSLLKFTFITSSIGSVAVLCVQRFMGIPSKGKSAMSIVMAVACVASWCIGAIFGAVPVVYDWIRYDPAEMLCAVFWESSYSDMLVYILCAFSISIFIPLLLILFCSILTYLGFGKECSSQDDLSSITPLLVIVYLFCYAAFAVSELVLLGRLDLSPSPKWLRSLSSVMAYLDCCLNPFIYCTNKGFREAVFILFWKKWRSTSTEPVLTGITTLEI